MKSSTSSSTRQGSGCNSVWSTTFVARRDIVRRVASREHPWESASGPSFIDLVLRLGRAVAPIECKRTRGGEWVFLVPEDEASPRSGARISWIAGHASGRVGAGCDELDFSPATYESSFCVVRGSGEQDRPMLERICSILLAASDALAVQEARLMERQPGQAWNAFYVPMVVTTANLAHHRPW